MLFNLEKLLFFDIETVSQYEDLTNMPKEVYKIWESYYDNFMKRVTDTSKLPNNDPNDLEYKKEVYRQTAAFFPEFGKVACISVAYVDKKGLEKYDSFYGKDEIDILNKTKELFNKIDGLGYTICGHNIKGFDIPFLAKRMVINGIKPPSIFPKHDTKPWELKVLDTKDIWSFGNNYGIGSLDLICSVLNIESPKNGDVRGDSVTTNFWENNDELIKDYCEKDVKSLVDIVKKFNTLV
jgi:3'-5' exonuclease